MSLLLVRIYLEIAILMTIGLGLTCSGWALATRLGARHGARPAARTWLVLGEALLIACVVLPLAAHALLRGEALFHAPVMVDAHRGLRARAPLAAAPDDSAAQVPIASRSVPFGGVAVDALASLLVGASAWGLAGLVRDERRLRRACASAVVFRRCGRVRIGVSETASVPFSAWSDGRAHVVLPERFAAEPVHLRIALAHELAHIRHRDPRRAHAAALLCALAPWHPALRIWSRWLARLEELACDERVLGSGRVTPRAYGECLLWASESARGTSPSPGLAIAMVGSSRTFLERRIAMLFRSPRVSRTSPWTILFAAAALAALAVTAILAQGAVAERRVGADDARRLAKDLAGARGFVVDADETVVAELNEILASADSRASFREGMERLAAYRKVSEPILRAHGVPVEMLAIPQQESRVQPLPETVNSMHSAGIWQFIPPTARRYGLRVEGKDDERLDPVRSAEAAASLLADLHEEFGDWRLAAAAYNAGSDSVHRAIDAQGTKDPAALAKSGAISRYASSVMAAAILIHHPDLLD
jgi:hypothetical protein